MLLSGEMLNMLNPAGSPLQKCASFWGNVEYVEYVQFLGKHCPPNVSLGIEHIQHIQHFPRKKHIVKICSPKN